jgi:hypothetical protein
MGALESRRNLDIFCRRFGLRGHEPQTLREIAEIYQISKTRVQQIVFWIGVQAFRRKTTICLSEEEAEKILPKLLNYIEKRNPKYAHEIKVRLPYKLKLMLDKSGPC